MQYQVKDPSPTVRWTVQSVAIEPINGVTATQLYNLMTGELKNAA